MDEQLTHAHTHVHTEREERGERREERGERLWLATERILIIMIPLSVHSCYHDNTVTQHLLGLCL